MKMRIRRKFHQGRHKVHVLMRQLFLLRQKTIASELRNDIENGAVVFICGKRYNKGIFSILDQIEKQSSIGRGTCKADQ